MPLCGCDFRRWVPTGGALLKASVTKPRFLRSSHVTWGLQRFQATSNSAFGRGSPFSSLLRRCFASLCAGALPPTHTQTHRHHHHHPHARSHPPPAAAADPPPPARQRCLCFRFYGIYPCSTRRHASATHLPASTALATLRRLATSPMRHLAVSYASILAALSGTTGSTGWTACAVSRFLFTALLRSIITTRCSSKSSRAEPSRSIRFWSS